MKKVEKLRATDSNPHLAIRIPHKEHEERTEERIRIPYTTIRIPKTGVLKNKARRFESSSYGFESLSKSKGRRLKVKRERFEFSSYRFESLLVQNSNLTQAIRIPYTAIRILHGVKFKSRSGNSNPWFYRSIKCVTCNSSYSIFKSNLSHNG